jgi:integrase
MPRPNRGPYVDPRPNAAGFYEIRWSEAGRSKRSSTRSTDFQSAQKVLANFILLKTDHALRENAIGPVLVRAVLGDPDDDEQRADYWNEHVLKKVVDRDSARYAILKLLRHFGHLAVRDILPEHVARYVDARKSGKIGRPSVGHTIAKELSFLNAAIVHAVKARRVPRADAPFIELPAASPPRERWLTREEAWRLQWAAIRNWKPGEPFPRLWRFLVLALGTASRKGALLSMKREQIDLAGGVIYLNPKGRAQTNKRRARVPIADWLRPILVEMLKQIPAKPDAYVLDHPGALRTSFDSACAAAGLTDVSPHTLRHTWGTWAAQRGVDLFDIAGVMGDTVKTVEKNYAHHHPDHLRSAVNLERKAA